MFAEIDGQRSVLFSDRLEALIRTHGKSANVHVFVHQMRSELQKGPTCGFAALLMALRCSHCQLAEQVTLQHLVEMGKQLGITYQGELFSAAWMCELVERLWPKKYQLKLTQFPTANAIIQHLISGKRASERRCPTTVLVPYDCDKNFEPCNRQGNAAHWALIIGFVLLEQSVQNGEEIHQNFDNEHLLYLVALQGKSRHPALWSYSALRESNGQLNVPTPKGNFRLAPEGLAAIKGKCVLFCGSKSYNALWHILDKLAKNGDRNRRFQIKTKKNSKTDNLHLHEMATNIIAGVSSVIGERQKGWKVVQKSLPRIVDYGRNEGILQIREYQRGNAVSNIPGIVIAAQEGLEAHQQAKENKGGDKVNLPTNDITLMHEAIPFLPFPIALVCLFLNVVLPGSGTILSGAAALCMGQPRVNIKEGRKLVTLLVNLLVGVSQFFTITFLFVGWFWSIAWGGLIIIHAMQYREALQQRRQEAVATAAIEALTKDSILHRRDVKTLVRQHKDKGKEDKERAKGAGENAPNANGMTGTQLSKDGGTATSMDATLQRDKVTKNGHQNGFFV